MQKPLPMVRFTHEPPIQFHPPAPPPVVSNVVVTQPTPSAPPTHTVIVQQPQPEITTRVTFGTKPWTTSLCDCFQDIPSCVLGFLCSCCLGGWIASRYNESCCLGFWGTATLTALRTKIRADFRIQGSICDDCICMTFFQPCVLCQMHRELNHKGFL